MHVYIHRETVLPANKFAIQARISKRKNMTHNLFPNEFKAII